MTAEEARRITKMPVGLKAVLREVKASAKMRNNRVELPRDLVTNLGGIVDDVLEALTELGYVAFYDDNYDEIQVEW